ncbi:hypothetical protein RRG08_008593 [Elysia crispata]|uniref:Uncharacterized protein n=1 Tax=Elysia crispata TaxID=231223 RepID=A0AAE1B7F3_9GAST|nr:hypothetical protein RRG08_008593 [Elysia crispata]
MDKSGWRSEGRRCHIVLITEVKVYHLKGRNEVLHSRSLYCRNFKTRFQNESLMQEIANKDPSALTKRSVLSVKLMALRSSRRKMYRVAKAKTSKTLISGPDKHQRDLCIICPLG